MKHFTVNMMLMTAIAIIAEIGQCSNDCYYYPGRLG